MERRRTKKNRLGPGSLVEEAGSEPGIPAHQLVDVLPAESFVTRHLRALTSSEFCSAYRALRAEERRIVVLALGRWRRELVYADAEDFGQRPEEFLRWFRQGTDLDLTGTTGLRLSTATRQLALAYQLNIDEYGGRALAHLCLSALTLGRLTRVGVETIDAAERVLREGVRVPYMTGKQRAELGADLADWQRLQHAGES